ncbi:MAG TPA: OsmC family protein [Bryobacteraceae bacterium]|nr:OsmC family protein [Bryobacteraceae bacterium]
MDLNVRYLGGKKFDAEARGHHVVSDQPLDDNGTDQGMTPPELFLGSLGSCAAYYAAEYLIVRGLSTDGLEVHVSALKEGKPVRIARIQIDVKAPGLDFADDRHREGLKRAVDACLIHNTLQVPTRVDIHIAESVEARDLVHA